MVKSALLLLTLTVLGTNRLISVQAGNTYAPMALFRWDETTHDFGKISQGKPVVAEFSFTNRGEVPLVISSARGSCGCTGVQYPREAILPGQSGRIKATFNAASTGAFSKSVIVDSNAEGGTVTLAIKGEVI